MRRYLQSLVIFSVSAAILATAAAARPAAAPTITPSARTVSFGAAVTLHGTIPGGTAGKQVLVMTEACGFTGAVPAGMAKTGAGGTFSVTIEPMLNATFSVQVDGVTSDGTKVRVRPGVQLRRVGTSSFAVDVSAGNGSWFTKSVVLQRYDPHVGAWRTVGSGVLRANSGPDALMAISSAAVHANVKRGSKVRALVPRSTVGSCYLPATSTPITA